MPRTHRCALVCLVWTLLFASLAAAGTGPEPPLDPRTRQGFTPGPYEVPAAVSPALPHSGASGPGLAISEPMTVNFADVALLSPPKYVGLLRSHIQGEVLQYEGGIDATQPRSHATSAIELGRPDVDTLTNKALGDIKTSFDGLANTGWIPPDTVVAVGPSRVLESTNSGVAVYDKAGSTLVGYTTFDTFFNTVKPVGWAGFMFDPRVHYSPTHGKFVMLALGLDQAAQGSYFFLAVSQTADPLGTWWIYRINTNFGGFTADAWLDYSGLGVDDWGVYFTGNYFLWAGGYKYSTIVSLGPAVLSGGSTLGWQFIDLRWPSNSFADTLQPALPMSIAGGQETFFVNSFSGFGSQLLLWTLTGDRTNAPTLNKAAISVASYQSIGQNVDQPGSATDIDGGDARVMNAVYSQRRVYATLTNDTNGNATTSGAFVAKLNVDSNAVEWNTTLDGGAGWYYFYPAIAVGDPVSTTPPVSLFMSWTHPANNFFASTAVRTYTAPPTDTSGPFPATAFGLASYVALDGNNRNRWGDYSGAGFDWTNATMWGATEYAGTGNTWRTVINELKRVSLIFTDGFESGTTGAWSSTSP